MTLGLAVLLVLLTANVAALSLNCFALSQFLQLQKLHFKDTKRPPLATPVRMSPAKAKPLPPLASAAEDRWAGAE